MVDIVRDTLLDLPCVSKILIHKNKFIRRRTYECAFNCNLIMNEKEVAVIICVPASWEHELIDIYIYDIHSVPFMPHIEKDGKICLFDLEGVLIDPDLPGIVTQCVKKAVKILLAGFYENTEEEFVREFASYWSYLPNLLHMKVSLPQERKSQIFKYIWNLPFRKKKEKYGAYFQRCQKTCIYASDSESYFHLLGVNGEQKNSLNCVIQTTKYIIPPDFRKPLSIDYCNELLAMMVPLKRAVEINKGRKAHLLIIDILQPNGAETCIGIFLKHGSLKALNDGRFQISIERETEVFPAYVTREDKAFLMKRTDDMRYDDKRILLIGCGSIGSYMCNELVKAGIENITLIDLDCLKAENVYRHLLGMEYVGQYKADALCRYFNKNVPNIRLKPIDGDIREMIEDGDIDLAEFDLIISATGNHNINRWIDEELFSKRVDAVVIYLWNEPLDIGCHVAVISGEHTGRYDSFFERDELTEELYDAVAYTAPNQKAVRNYSGCGGSYIPYGSNVSLKTVAAGMDWVRRVFDHRCDDNYLISIKGEGYYFDCAGLKKSSFYSQQKEEIAIQKISFLAEGKK